MNSQCRFAVLGPVRAWRGDDEIDLGSPQQQTVLAALLLAEGTYVPVSALVEAVWGDPGPASAVSTLRTYIYRLRKALEPAIPSARSVIRSRGDTYALATRPDTCDLQAFKGMVARADVARREDRAKDAALWLADALALWDGDALAGLKGEWAASSRHFLQELRLTAATDRLAAELDLGAGSAVATESARLVVRHPLDERVRALHMRALYQSGRQAAALAAYSDVRGRLARELGVSPGPGLRSLHQRILEADPGLLPAVGTAPGPAADARAVPSLPGPPEGLPAAPAVFIGRQLPLDAVEDFLARLGSHRKGPGILTVSGPAGIGKTAFALQVAHRFADRYPGGQVFLDLHGGDETRPPLSIDQAQRGILRSLGTVPENLPQSPDAVTHLLHRVLADRRVLLVLDNARDTHQVRALLPGAAGSLVVVTSRHGPTTPMSDAALSVVLEPFTGTESHALLARLLGGERLAAEPEAARQVMDWGGGLPRALAVAAARAGALSAQPLTAAARELRAEGRSVLSGTPGR